MSGALKNRRAAARASVNIPVKNSTSPVSSESNPVRWVVAWNAHAPCPLGLRPWLRSKGAVVTSVFMVTSSGRLVVGWFIGQTPRSVVIGWVARTGEEQSARKIVPMRPVPVRVAVILRVRFISMCNKLHPNPP